MFGLLVKLLFFLRVVRFPVPGLEISLPSSGFPRTGTHQLVLENLSTQVSGTYACQVEDKSELRHVSGTYACQVEDKSELRHVSGKYARQ